MPFFIVTAVKTLNLTSEMRCTVDLAITEWVTETLRKGGMIEIRKLRGDRPFVLLQIAPWVDNEGQIYKSTSGNWKFGDDKTWYFFAAYVGC
jgi:hypothetical protein